PRETLDEFVIIRHVMTAFSIPLSMLCIYIVITSRSLTRDYALMLVVLLIDSAIIDIFTQLVFDPSFHSYIVCMY
ncbi:hypothetical protein PMAYCL1PPCAC_09221, partial [Pristionchus mayeri]